MFASIPQPLMKIGPAHLPAECDPEVSRLAQKYSSVLRTEKGKQKRVAW